MKHTKKIKASRDTAPVVRSGTSVYASREALLFQMKKSITTKTETHNFGFTKGDITLFQRAAASVGMTLEDWAKQALRGTAECDLEPVPAREAVEKEEMTTLFIKLSKQDLARCNRAAIFSCLSLHRWAWDAVMNSMECDEDDMTPEAARNPKKFAQIRETEIGREKPGWEYREALPFPDLSKYSN